MEIISTSINDLFILKPNVYEDNRGHFFESFNSKIFTETFPKITFVQDNESISKYGVIRGLHFQKKPFEQTKLVRVISGKILDVVVDLRKDSITFGTYASFILSEKNKKQLLIPKGFAHGFLTLSKTATVSYKVDNYYSPSSDCGIIFDDPDLDIDWGINLKNIIISKKDKNLKSFNYAKNLL